MRVVLVPIGTEQSVFICVNCGWLSVTGYGMYIRQTDMVKYADIVDIFHNIHFVLL